MLALVTHLTVDLAELRGGITECYDFSGADECEVQRIEEEDEVLSTVVVKTDLLKLAIDGRLAFEEGGLLL